jgi:hypothetical protein
MNEEDNVQHDVISVVDRYINAALRAGKQGLRCPVCGKGHIATHPSGTMKLCGHPLEMTYISLNGATESVYCSVCWCPMTPEWWRC